MKYLLNTTKLGNAFMLPKELVSKHLKLAGAVQLKVILSVFSAIEEEIVPEKIAGNLNLDVNDVSDALGFWCELGYLKTESVKEPAPKKAVLRKTEKPSREEIADRAESDDKIKFILSEAEQKFGRTLRQNECSSLIWLYSDEGLAPSILIMLLDYCRINDKMNIGYIERVAIDWINAGVDTVAAAEERIAMLEARKKAWHKVSAAFGLVKRSPSAKEERLAYKWVYEWGYDRAILKEAYDRTVDTISEFKMNYVEKVLASFYKNGIKNLSDLKEYDEKKANKKASSNYGTYDKEAFKKSLEKDYE